MLDNFVIDRYNSKSVGVQIASFLGKKINSKEFSPGQKLPSVREITKALNVGNHTVQEALEILSKNGLVKVTNKGTFIAGDLPVNVLKGDITEKNEITQRDFALIVPSVWRPRDAQLVEGISCAIKKQGQDRHLVVFNTEADIDKQGNAILEVIDRGFSGAILITPVEKKTPACHVRMLQKNNIPVVFCNRSTEGCSAPLVTFDAGKVGQLAAEKIAEKGHQRVAFLGVYRYSISLKMEHGFREGLKKYGIELDNSNVFYQKHTDTYGNEKELLDETSAAIESILKRPDRPTAIFCFDSSAEVLIYLIAQKLELNIPEDLSIIRYGINAHNCVISNLLTSIWSDTAKLGAKAAEVLNEICEHKRPLDDPSVVYLPVNYEERLTLARAPK